MTRKEAEELARSLLSDLGAPPLRLTEDRTWATNPPFCNAFTFADDRGGEYYIHFHVGYSEDTDPHWPRVRIREAQGPRLIMMGHKTYAS